MNRLMTCERLREDNRAFDGTGGVSAGNCTQGFIPAFCDTETGKAVPSRHADGSLASIHLLVGLPPEWAVELGNGNVVLAVKETVIAGFLRAGVFFTRDQAAQVVGLY
jgi:hypothetical protein